MNSRKYFIFFFSLMGIFWSIFSYAGAITVTTTADEAGTNSVACSLREAIQTANNGSNFGGCTLNSDGNANITITLSAHTDASTPYRLNLGSEDDTNASGDLDITSTNSVTIDSNDADLTVIDGNGNTRVFDIFRPAIVFIYRVTIKNGNNTSEEPSGLRVATGASLDLERSIVTNNTGGGIANSGALTLKNMMIRGNQGRGIQNNSGASGALTNVTIAENTAQTTGWGGGITNVGFLELVNVTISGNTVGGTAGLVSPDRGSGGGIFNGTSANMNIRHGTIVNNTSQVDGAGIYNLGTITLKNSILSNNRLTSSEAKNCDSSLGTTSRNYNISSDTTCSSFLVGTGDRNSTDPLLASLASNGAIPYTHALNTGSPAKDAIPVLDDTTCASTDARGITRPQPPGNNCDIGAFEVSSTDTGTGGSSGTGGTGGSGSSSTSGCSLISSALRTLDKQL